MTTINEAMFDTLKGFGYDGALPDMYREYLLAETGSDLRAIQDLERELLASYGYSGAIQEMWFNYLRTAGYSNTLQEMLYAFWNDGQGFTPFWVPLTHTAVPTRAASGTTATFTRATTSTWQNNDGYLVRGVAGEIGFVGARRIYNKLTNTGWSGAASGTYGTVPTGWTADVGTGTLTVASSATYTGHNQITFTATAQRPFIRLAVAVAAYSVNILSVRVVENASGEPINDIITGSSVPAGSTETYSVNGSTVAASYVPVAGDVIEYKIATAATAGTPNWRIGLGCQGAATGSVTLVSPQLEDVTAQTTQTAGEYVSIGVESAPYYHGSMVDGVKCFPTDLSGSPIPSTTLLGYQAEGARTNYQPNSNAFTTTWFKTANVSLAQNAVDDDGATTAWTATITGAGQYITYATTGVAADQTCTLSVNLWPVDAGTTRIAVYNTTGGNQFYADCNPTTGLIALTGFTGGASVLVTSVKPIAGGGYRFSLTGSTGGTGAQTNNPVVYYGTDVDVKHSKIQFEIGAFPSSFIATTTIAVARNADVLTYSSAGNVSGTVGAAYAEIQNSWSTAAGTSEWALSFNTSAAGMIDSGDNSSLAFRAYDGTNTVTATAGNSNTSVVKQAMAWGGTTLLAARSGTTASGTFDGDMSPTAIYPGGYLQLYGTIRNVRIWQRALSSSELQAVTS